MRSIRFSAGARRSTAELGSDIHSILRGAFRDGFAATTQTGRSCAAFEHCACLAAVVASAAVALELESAWSDVCGMHSTKHVSLVVWRKEIEPLVSQFYV